MFELKKLENRELPQIDFYMDQVLTLLEQQMESYKIDEDEKIMTKTMVNNYVKSKLIEKPIKKKYNKDQLMQLIMIFHFKNILTLAELDTFFKTVKEEEDYSLENLYDDFIEIHGEAVQAVNEKANNLSQIQGKQQIKELMKTIVTSDLNRRMAEKVLHDMKEAEQFTDE